MIDAHVHINPAYQLGSENNKGGIHFISHGRVLFPDGKIGQFLPDILADSSFTMETLIHVMDNAGIEKALIIASNTRQVPDVINAVSLFPNRFKGAMVIRMDEHTLDTIELYHRLGLSVMKFEMSDGLGFTSPFMYPDFKFDSPLMMDVLNKANELGITVTIDPSRIGSKGYQTAAFDHVTSEFPLIPFVICHLGFPDPAMQRGSDTYNQWHALVELAKKKNVWFDVSALAVFFTAEGYPYPSAVKMVREFIDTYGSNKLIWGSDIPGSMCHATYRQLIEMFERCYLFSEAEKDLLFYDNAVSAYFSK
jgi:predicted TIM-barrel fold metal-dependent hydrolase